MPYTYGPERTALTIKDHSHGLLLYGDVSLAATGISMKWNEECFQHLLELIPLDKQLQLTYSVGTALDLNFYSPADHQGTIYLARFLHILKEFSTDKSSQFSTSTLDQLQCTLHLSDNEVAALLKMTAPQFTRQVHHHVLRMINMLTIEVVIRAAESPSHTNSPNQSEALFVPTIFTTITVIAFIYLCFTQADNPSLLWGATMLGVLVTAMSYAYATNHPQTIRFEDVSAHAEQLAQVFQPVKVFFPVNHKE